MRGKVRYCTSADGTRIAFTVFGGGEPPLVLVPHAGFGGLSHDMRVPQVRARLERLAEGQRVVAYDARGRGLSDRNVGDLSLDALVEDLAATIDQIGSGAVALFARGNAGPVALAYAHRHAARVARIVLWCSAAGGREYRLVPRERAIRGLLTSDWELYTQTLAIAENGWNDTARILSEAARDSVTPELLQAAWGVARTFDVEGLLPGIRCPVLIVHRAHSNEIPMQAVRRMAALLPAATVEIVERDGRIPFLGEWSESERAILQFLGEGRAGGLTGKGLLTPREREILRLVASGKSNREIAEALLVSERTVARHIANVYEKIDVHTRAAATAWALQHRVA
jgi:pimeloyl-ACP methyl ester carboxylesterase/DNA-binding CsgD family transcriptional regulator